jgi:hypothetical protein
LTDSSVSKSEKQMRQFSDSRQLVWDSRHTGREEMRLLLLGLSNWEGYMLERRELRCMLDIRRECSC